MAVTNTLPDLLNTLDDQASLADRHIWLIALLQWIRGDESTAEASVSRLQTFMVAVEEQPEMLERLRAWWRVLMQTVDVTTLLADFGFAPRTAFLSELAERLRRKMLPGTPETRDASELFLLAARRRFDAQWMGALSEPQVRQLARLLSSDVAADTLRWQQRVMDALAYCTAQIQATGFAPELRLRMDSATQDSRVFHALASDVDALRAAFFSAPQPNDSSSDGLEIAMANYRERLDACRQAVNSVYAHLEDNGISVGMVFRLRQLRARIVRVRELLDALVSPSPAMAAMKLLGRRVVIGQDGKSIGSLISTNSTLLSAKMAERNAQTGEHYISRTRAEYKDMLGKAMGGGAVTALTTLLKFMVVGLALSAFWSGFWSGLAYSSTFILIQLLHFTLATKQPAMTAPAMAAKLKDIDSDTAVSDFVDEAMHLVRSQAAAVFGNVFLVVPAVLLVNTAVTLLMGRPMIGQQEARHVLHTLTLLGPTLLWAGFTGVILFAASMIGGWAENWFVLHRLDSAMRHNPRITRVLGLDRAARWSHFMGANISGFASNISLGFMLGLIPAFTGFFGLELEARHVTLSAGQLTAAGASLGLEAFHSPAIWWCMAAIPLIGALNLGVSFYFAFRLALQAHNVSHLNRKRIRSAVWARWRSQPLRFFFPS
ncbi:MAG: site-specific recombinase [Polaromonas sp.]|nr:site-specific recombinase [Polaromonas sp.]